MSVDMLQIESVDKVYGTSEQAVHAVKGLNMSVRQGEIVSLLGSSGCGKTSTLRMIAGFESVTNGSIRVAGQLINKLPPVKRGVAMAFEGYSLYPPLTIRDNVAFALKAAKLKKADIDNKVDHVCQMLEIDDILGRYPGSVSAGQQQRVSLARALVRDAKLHLLDEPMGQLEPQLRALLRGRIKHYIKDNGLTAILVTHDQAEANALSDRIAVMEAGFLQQFETPDALKDKPVNLFTGTFIGEPPMNVFTATVSCDDKRLQFSLVSEPSDDGSNDLSNDLTLTYDRHQFSEPVVQAALQHRTVDIGVRPYAVRRSSGGIPATIYANQWLGDQTHIAASLAGQRIVLVEHDRAPGKPGDTIGIELEPDSLHLFDKQSGRAISHGQQLVS